LLHSWRNWAPWGVEARTSDRRSARACETSRGDPAPGPERYLGTPVFLKHVPQRRWPGAVDRRRALVVWRNWLAPRVRVGQADFRHVFIGSSLGLLLCHQAATGPDLRGLAHRGSRHRSATAGSHTSSLPPIGLVTVLSATNFCPPTQAKTSFWSLLAKNRPKRRLPSNTGRANSKGEGHVLFEH
jgi:hypothetical protein